MLLDEDRLLVPSKEKTWRTQLCICVTIATWKTWGDHKHHIAYVQSASQCGPCRSGLVIMLPVQRPRCELHYGWYAEHLCSLQLSRKQISQCLIKLSVHGHPGPPLQILHSEKQQKKKQSVSYSKLNASGPCTAGTSTIAIGRLDSAVKATKFLSVFLRGFSTPSTIRLCQCTIKRKDKASNSYLNIQKIQAKDMANLRIHIPTRYFLLRLFDVCSWRKIYTAFLKND